MAVELLINSINSLYPSGLTWPVVFWVVLVVLATLEAWLPAVDRPPRRWDRWETNIGLGFVNGILAPLAPVSAVIGATWAAGQGVGLLHVIDAPVWIAFVATIAVRSLAGYAIHVTMHKVPLLWRLHRVHHLDVHIDVTTGLRGHPVEYAVNVLIMTSLAIALGLSPMALVAYEIVEAMMNLATHTNLRLPRRLDGVLRTLLVTPNMHRLHHSTHQPETDSNYGGVFSVWDRMFGTYSAEAKVPLDRMQFGLKEVRDERASNLWWQIKSPVLGLPRANNTVDP